MAVTRSFAAAREESFQEVEKLINSHSLRGSESLCRLIRYLAEHSLADPPASEKEYQIATEVFGRSAHFDPQSDSTVRVQAGRLRTKLAEYYASEGAEDSILVELPKGTYVLAFHHRSAGTARTHSGGSSLHEPEEAPAQNTSRNWLPAFVARSRCALLAGLSDRPVLSRLP